VEERLLGLMTFVTDEDGFAGTGLVPQRLRNRRADRRIDYREISGGMPSSLRSIFVSRARTIIHRPSVDDSPPRATYGCRSNAHRAAPHEAPAGALESWTARPRRKLEIAQGGLMSMIYDAGGYPLGKKSRPF